MSLRPILIAISIAALAISLRATGGPGNAYLHGAGGGSDEPFYISEGFYLGSALGDGPRERQVGAYAISPVMPLYLSLAPRISPFRIEPSDVRPGEATDLQIRSPGGRSYSIAYLEAGGEREVRAAYESLVQVGQEYEKSRGYREAVERLALGEPAFVSASATERLSAVEGPFRLARDPLVVRGSDGVRLIDRANDKTIVLLPSNGVDSAAISVGHDDPLSFVIATIDRDDTLRVWRFRDLRSWTGDGDLLVFTEHFEEAAAVSAGPSGDLLLVSARSRGEWRLLTYDTIGGIERIGETTSPGALRLFADTATRTVGAIDERGRSWEITGGPLEGARLLIALVAAVGALLATLIGWRLAGTSGALGAGLLLALDPLGVELGRIAYLEPLLATEAVAIAGVLLAAGTSSPERRWRWFAVAGALCGLAAATKASAVPLGVATIFAALFFTSARMRAWSAVASVAIAVAIAGLGIIGGAPGPLAGGFFLAVLGLSLPRFGRPGGVTGAHLAVVVIAMLTSYAVPWVLRGLLVSLSADEGAFEHIVRLHREIFRVAGFGASLGSSVWWLWPSGLESDAIETFELWRPTFISGLLLATGLVAVGGVKRRAELAVGLLLLLLWGSWSFFSGYEKVYYAALPTAIAAIVVMMAARHRGDEGRIAIPIAILTPIAGSIFYEFYAPDSPATAVIALLTLLATSRLLTERRVPIVIAVVGWVIGGLSAVMAGHFDLPLVAVIAGLAAGVAGRGAGVPLPSGSPPSGRRCSSHRSGCSSGMGSSGRPRPGSPSRASTFNFIR